MTPERSAELRAIGRRDEHRLLGEAMDALAREERVNRELLTQIGRAHDREVALARSAEAAEEALAAEREAHAATMARTAGLRSSHPGARGAGTLGARRSGMSPTCHPDRTSYARHLCRACYVRERRLELGAELRLSLAPEVREALAGAARVAGVPIARLAGAWLAERALAEASEALTAQPGMQVHSR